MKKFLLLLPILALTGCSSLIPARLEFFKSKVKPFPELTSSQRETQRQAAALAATKANETLLAATKASSPASVTNPASDAASLTHAVSTSLGPPESPWSKPAIELATKLDTADAKLNNKIESFAKREEKFVGKSVEGTGLFSISYFSYIGIIIGLVLLAWTALKAYGMVNPAVGVATNVVGRVNSAILAKSVSEISAGGEAFKEYLAKSGIEDKVKAQVLDLFSRGHKENQSTEVQDLVQKLTK